MASSATYDEAKRPIIRRFELDQTIRWSARAGQFVFWISQRNWLVSFNTPDDWRILDLWELRDGDFLTITSRVADLPEWFQLYPEETAGMVALQFDFDNAAEAPVEGPNIWRVESGHRLVWVDENNAAQPVVEILDLWCDALVVGDSVSTDFDRRMLFGASKKLAGRPGAFKAVRAGFVRAVQIGPAQSISVGWGFGG